jgi:signal transduction histidine kinase
MKNEDLEKRVVQLEEENAMLKSNIESTKRFTSVMIHDLKTPLNAIYGFSDLLATSDELTEDEKKKFYSIINQSSEKVTALLNEFRVLNMMQNGRVVAQKSYINLGEIVNDVYGLNIAVFNSKKLNFYNDINQEDKVYADESMVKTIVRNIVGNAIKFTNEGGEISISGSMFDENMYRIDMRDTGEGMSEETLYKLTKGDIIESTFGTKGESGTGLGLQFVKGFLEMNNGFMEVASKKGIGTTFSIYLPTKKY